MGIGTVALFLAALVYAVWTVVQTRKEERLNPTPVEQSENEPPREPEPFVPADKPHFRRYALIICVVYVVGFLAFAGLYVARATVPDSTIPLGAVGATLLLSAAAVMNWRPTGRRLFTGSILVFVPAAFLLYAAYDSMVYDLSHPDLVTPGLSGITAFGYLMAATPLVVSAVLMRLTARDFPTASDPVN